jgi:hypothetical protein
MNDLLERAITAHGGLERWKTLERLTVTAVSGGGLFGFPAAQYVTDIVAVDGIRFPTRRRAYIRAPDLKPIRDLLMVAIDFNNFRFERRLAGEKR